MSAPSAARIIRISHAQSTESRDNAHAASSMRRNSLQKRETAAGDASAPKLLSTSASTWVDLRAEPWPAPAHPPALDRRQLSDPANEIDITPDDNSAESVAKRAISEKSRLQSAEEATATAISQHRHRGHRTTGSSWKPTAAGALPLGHCGCQPPESDHPRRGLGAIRGEQLAAGGNQRSSLARSRFRRSD